jgi:hypothetical protein
MLAAALPWLSVVGVREAAAAPKWGSYGTGNSQFHNTPMGLAVDNAGNVSVADDGKFRIQKFPGDGTFLTTWGSLGNGGSPGTFNDPADIGIEPNGDRRSPTGATVTSYRSSRPTGTI